MVAFSGERSQRQPGFNGGIQMGTVAASGESIALEQCVKLISDEFADVFSGLEWIPELSGRDISRLWGLPNPTGIVGVRPDGGIWVDAETKLPVLVSEAKKQGKGGNAIERWYKNYGIIKMLNPDAYYLTFCSGVGFFDNNPAEKILYTAAAYELSKKFGKSDLSPKNVWNAHTGQTRIYRFSEFVADVGPIRDAFESLPGAIFKKA